MSTDPFPPYSYVPGGPFPHPVSRPDGHSFGVRPVKSDPPDPETWWNCAPYLRGLELFNHGYYWEAHEAWEGLWHACGRRGTTATFMKGLIQLAVAGVKVREGKPDSVRSHARRSADLLRQVRSQLPADQTGFMGLNVGQLLAVAEENAEHPPLLETAERMRPVVVVLPALEPTRLEHESSCSPTSVTEAKRQGQPLL
jgi:hypothetical protein